MWTPPQDELISASSPAAVKHGTWTPPAEEALDATMHDDTDPGALKSAAAGLMSGIPLAETATAGIKSALGDKTYEEEHKALEDLKDKAWAKHPIAYGTGKASGIVGSTALAPESVAGRIALAAGMGAGSGVDAADKVKDIPMDAVKGAGVGAVFGTAGEGISAALTKALPGAAKGVVNSLAGGSKNADTYLADSAGVNASLGKTAAGEKLADRANDLGIASGHLSDDALSKLRPDVAPISMPIKNSNPMVGGMVGEDTLSPLFAPVENTLTANGVAVGQAQKNAISALQGYKDSLAQIAAQNGGKIPETVLGKIVRDMQSDVNWNVDDAVVNSAKKQLEGTINDLLKTSNPEYGAAMEKVSEPLDLAGKLKHTFKLGKDDEGNLINSDTTNQKMGTVTDEGKSNAQDLLNKVGDFTGFDFLKNADFNKVKEALNSGGHSNALLNVLGHTGGYAAGRLSGIPGGGLVGSLIGGTAAHAADGGQVAKGIMDRYLAVSKNPSAIAASAALKKYGPMLINAAKQGGNQLAATHYVLATSHPEYQALMDETQNQDK